MWLDVVVVPAAFVAGYAIGSAQVAAAWNLADEQRARDRAAGAGEPVSVEEALARRITRDEDEE